MTLQNNTSSVLAPTFRNRKGLPSILSGGTAELKISHFALFFSLELGIVNSSSSEIRYRF